KEGGVNMNDKIIADIMRGFPDGRLAAIASTLTGDNRDELAHALGLKMLGGSASVDADAAPVSEKVATKPKVERARRGSDDVAALVEEAYEHVTANPGCSMNDICGAVAADRPKVVGAVKKLRSSNRIHTVGAAVAMRYFPGAGASEDV